jgi:hypothetical protein
MPGLVSLSHNFCRRHRDIILDLLAGVALAVALSLVMDRASFGLGSGDAWVFYYGQF